MRIATIFLLALACVSAVQAQDEDAMQSEGMADTSGVEAQDKDWEVFWTPYLYLYNMNGSATTKGSKSEIDSDISDLVDALDGGLTSYLQFRYKRFLFFNDIAYLSLESSVEADVSGTAEFNAIRNRRIGRLRRQFGIPVRVPVSAETDIDLMMEQWAVKAAVGYRVWEHGWGSPGRFTSERRMTLDLFTGVLYNRLTIEIDGEVDLAIGPVSVGPAMGRRVFRTSEDINVDETEDWWQHLYAARFATDLTERLSFSVYGDIATNYHDEDLTATARGLLNYRLTRHVSSYAGYQFMSIEHNEGDFELDVDTHGPILGLGFYF